VFAVHQAGQGLGPAAQQAFGFGKPSQNRSLLPSGRNKPLFCMYANSEKANGFYKSAEKPKNH